eukprot:SAG11_NODE_37374_length_257_cov_0.651899_1_plen_24_part_10
MGAAWQWAASGPARCQDGGSLAEG